MFLTCATARLASTHAIKALFLKVGLSVSARRLRRCGVPRAVCCGSGEFWARRNFGIRIITVVLHIADARHIHLLYCCSVRAYGELAGRVSIVPKRQVCTSRCGGPTVWIRVSTVSSPTRAVTELVGLYTVISTSFTCQGDSHTVPVTVSPFVNFLSRTIPKMFPSVVLVLVCCWQTETLLRPAGVLRRCPGSCLRPALVLVCSLPYVTPSAPCRRTWMAPGDIENVVLEIDIFVSSTGDSTS